MRYLIYFSIIFLLFSCEQIEEKQEETTTQSSNSESNYWVDNHCMRSKPIPTIDSSLVENHTFVLKKDKAIEEATLPDGNKLIIHNEGCEVFWLSFTFYINNYDQNKPNIDQVIYAFEETSKVEIAPIDFDLALNLLKKIKENGGNIKLGNEYFLKMDSVSEMFEIDEIDLKKGYATVDFSFAIGKL